MAKFSDTGAATTRDSATDGSLSQKKFHEGRHPDGWTDVTCTQTDLYPIKTVVTRRQGNVGLQNTPVQTPTMSRSTKQYHQKQQCHSLRAAWLPSTQDPGHGAPQALNQSRSPSEHTLTPQIGSKQPIREKHRPQKYGSTSR